MALLLLKKLSLLFLLISATLLSTSLAGRESKWVSKLAKEGDANHEGIPRKLTHHNEEESIHERLLKVNTKDYGRYDPAPALVKPPFKLIPN
ncbi:protein CASPARIAN STRIP INTEGRITY FACTOR 1-like [Fagus crenata]